MKQVLLLGPILLWGLQSWPIEALPRGAVIIVKAASVCGAEETYYFSQRAIDGKELSSVKWLLNYILSEKKIGDFDFAEDTGTYIDAQDLAEPPGKDIVSRYPKLEKLLVHLKAARIELQKWREAYRSKPKAATDPEVKKAVDAYENVKAEALDAVKQDRGVRSVDTGASCD